ncbi:spore germination protein [Paenibacillus aurantius]|uniref:Spore germination protein n=1 Tax=Paenibacillus aurantius TaxID=2918900 RepID=A0AA96LBA8_9BACL|nr:spore germination protein [Paenibacillus aurantius]WJH34751.1 spore germination protein [Paenibacillus sp. CC-CFT747]WNQ09964.1 spore germination protein [Paenibacillus aurantius]
MLRHLGVHIDLNNINVNSIDRSSGIFIGPNTQWGWSAHSKSLAGFGTINGMFNRCSHNLNVVYDNDLIDTPIDDRDIMISRVIRSEGVEITS